MTDKIMIEFIRDFSVFGLLAIGFIFGFFYRHFFGHNIKNPFKKGRN